jgi:hypothetical protein
MGWFDDIINNTFQGISDIFSGNIGQGLSEVAPAAIAAGTAYMTGGASLGAESLAGDAFLPGALAESSGDAFLPGLMSDAGSFVGPSSDLASMSGDAFLPGALSGAAASPTSGFGSLGSLLGYAKTAAPIIGGLGQLLGGVGSLQASRQSGQLAGQADPFSPYRSGYAAQLSELMRNPQTVTSTPGYQFNLAQGLQAQQAQQAAQGRLVSGGALLQGQQFGQQLAGQTYNQQLETLAGLSGASQSPAAGATAAGQLLQDPSKALATAFQGFGGGAANVINPLQTLYSQYNEKSPSP